MTRYYSRKLRDATFADAVETGGAHDHDESRKDRALTLGLVADVGCACGGCRACFGMPWRRHWNGCIGCGLPYEAERIVHPVPDMKSNMGDVENAA